MRGRDTTQGDPSPPMNLESNWYVAERGVQSGPFAVEQARAWVAERPPEAELYCWTDGFDDWRPVKAVAQFRDVERQASASLPEPGAPASAAIQPGLVPDAPGLDLEIGEVSRVVKLPMLEPPSSSSGTAGGLPGVGAARAPTNSGIAGARLGYGTGSSAALRQTGGLPSLGGTGGLPAIERRHSRAFWVLVALGGASVLAVGGILLYLTLGGDEGASQALRRSRTADNTLGYTIRADGQRVPSTGADDGEGDTAATEDTAGSGRRGGRGNRKSIKSATRRVERATLGNEVDLEDRGGGDEARALGPQDVEAKYRSSQYLINRCYERALKRDPFLDIKKAIITVNVDLAGRTSATVPIQNKVLRGCLQSTVERWSFGKPKEAFRTKLTVIFKR